MKRSETESARLLTALKRHLKSHGWTAARIAQRLSIGDATVKRWLAGKALTLDKLERLAGLCDVSLAELVRETEKPQSGLAHELTLAQEKALLSDEFLALMFFTILSGYPPEETTADFELPPRMVEAALTRLERLALIDRLSGGRVRPLVDRTIIWRKAPMRTLFDARMKNQFLSLDFAAPETVYASEMLKLSPQGTASLAELIEAFRRDVQALARKDRDTTHLPGQWITTLAVMRPLDTSGLDRLRG
ncbi:helix-turn-helix domain-containing protein [uncultured Sphingorhabdus sp.]|uniref:helix-turn-helix domain-containing protein n=1 Tax=uncultured Sphingorhabdus sp. TaxID=1686106 RepID=UPI00260E2EC2|nr:helix-turn-helix domain-containing protein [uncultured Sphingorhabdus sp.]HMS19873.1 helix-turn-helix domain-containing protein [Sphingorhabdus sp.]